MWIENGLQPDLVSGEMEPEGDLPLPEADSYLPPKDWRSLLLGLPRRILGWLAACLRFRWPWSPPPRHTRSSPTETHADILYKKV